MSFPGCYEIGVKLISVYSRVMRNIVLNRKALSLNVDCYSLFYLWLGSKALLNWYYERGRA